MNDDISKISFWDKVKIISRVWKFTPSRLVLLCSVILWCAYYMVFMIISLSSITSLDITGRLFRLLTGTLLFILPSMLMLFFIHSSVKTDRFKIPMGCIAVFSGICFGIFVFSLVVEVIQFNPDPLIMMLMMTGLIFFWMFYFVKVASGWAEALAVYRD